MTTVLKTAPINAARSPRGITTFASTWTPSMRLSILMDMTASCTACQKTIRFRRTARAGASLAPATGRRLPSVFGDGRTPGNCSRSRKHLRGLSIGLHGWSRSGQEQTGIPTSPFARTGVRGTSTDLRAIVRCRVNSRIGVGYGTGHLRTSQSIRTATPARPGLVPFRQATITAFSETEFSRRGNE